MQDLTIDSTVGRTQYQFMMGAVDQKELATWTNKLMAQLRLNPKLEDISSDIQNSGLSAYIQVDRDTAARLGVSLATVDNVLYDAFGQRIVSTIFTQSNQYRVILQASDDVSRSPQALNDIYLQSTTNGAVPLSAIATVREQAAPLQESHLGQFPATTVSFNLAKGVSLGESVTLIQQAEKAVGVPESITTTFTGAAEAYRASLANELWLIVAAIVAIYIVLGVLYESFIHPITILSTLPSAAVGALIALLLAGQDLGVIGIIGIILLDRHREEERHHDDRLRPRCGAQPGQDRPRRHPPGGPAALPADPDDHHGGAAGGGAAVARRRHRGGAAPAPGRGDHRRAGLLPAADPVHHACDLHRLRHPGLALRPARSRRARPGMSARAKARTVRVTRPAARRPGRPRGSPYAGGAPA